ncbi:MULTISPECIES: hypothetical protein [Asticcacaulis]|uniref:hypothetical protein n=1 Tax=Asticcacaulis TaxID=76890 RepID=UPI001AE870EE|nr:MULTISPECIES: hypothetical protein [Asticcacaulis]MBP2159658.1 hypothetical protein [Asticcacaulis solisilvae]MDR6800515.1 hypothetical protein [Asticcacaulis sp. BE141]
MAEQIHNDRDRFNQSQSGQSQSQHGQSQDNTILHPEQANSLGNGSLGDGAGGNGLGGETAGLDSIAGIQGQAAPDTELPGSADTSYANARTDIANENTIAAEGVSPDTGVVSPAETSVDRDTQDIQNNAADAIMGGSSDVVQKPQGGDTPFKHKDQPQDAAERRDDPLSQEGTYEGKLVFRPNELNQSGEDKEYFPPEDQHRFRVPQDAQHHVLRPDVTLKPGGGKLEIEMKDKQ